MLVSNELNVAAVAQKQAVRTVNLLRCHWYYTEEFHTQQCSSCGVNLCSLDSIEHNVSV